MESLSGTILMYMKWKNGFVLAFMAYTTSSLALAALTSSSSTINMKHAEWVSFGDFALCAEGNHLPPHTYQNIVKEF